MDLSDTLVWCIQNNLVITFEVKDGVLCVTATNQNISSTYPIPTEFGPTELGESLLLALHGVEHGTRFHQEHGMFPPVPSPIMSEARIAHRKMKGLE